MAPHPPGSPTATPRDDEIERAWPVRTLQVIVAANLLAIIGYSFLAPLNPEVRLVRLWVVLPLLLITVASGVLARSGRVRLASLLIVGGTSLTLAAVALFNGGVRAPAFPALIVMVLMGGLLLGVRAALAVALFSILVGLVATFALPSSLFDSAVTPSDSALLVAYAVCLLLAAVVTGLTMSSMHRVLQLARLELHERRAAEEKFARAFRSSPVAMTVVRMVDGVVLDVNAAFCTLFGVPREQALGRTVADLGVWADETERLRVAHELVNQGALHELEFEFRRRDGDRGTALFSAELLEFDGTRCALAAVLDLTARKRAEAERLRLEGQMLQAQKLESLGLLAGGIAHDFNNLMASVLGNASLILLDTAPEDPRRPQLVAIEQAGRRAADLCDQLLIYAGRGHPQIEPVDMAALVHEMVGIVRLSVGHHATLAMDLAPQLPAVAADASQLRQVVLNLVTNAAEAIDPARSGTITVRLRAADFDGSALAALNLIADLAPGRYLVLEVADSGIGMDAETARQIFDPFFTTKPTGHGLGLSAVQGIVRRHGGAVGVRSAVGVGTTFTVLLPPTSLAPVPPPATPSPTAWGASGAVLVVDDEEGVRNLARRVLERFKVPVLVAAGGREALEIYSARSPEIALVLLDLTMPDLDGAATLAELRRLNAGLPVLISSGYSNLDIADLQLDSCTGFIQKPYRAQELMAKINEMLG